MANPNNELLHHKLNSISKDNDILHKQLIEANRDYGNGLLRQKELADELTESRRESAELRAQLHRVTEQQGTATVGLQLEVKMLKHRCKEAEEEVEKMRKKAETAAALEDEILSLKMAAEVAKEKALKEKEEAVKEIQKLVRDKDVLLDCATTRFKAVEKRFVALEAYIATMNKPSDSSSSGQTARVSIQETMDTAIVDLDSD